MKMFLISSSSTEFIDSNDLVHILNPVQLDKLCHLFVAFICSKKRSKIGVGDYLINEFVKTFYEKEGN